MPGSHLPCPLLIMSDKERMRSHWMRQIHNGQTNARLAAQALSLTDRRIRQLYQLWLKHGDGALISKRRGRTGNRQRHADRVAFLAWYGQLNARGRYEPKHAAEQFAIHSGIVISKETVRQWLSHAGYWQIKARRQPRIHLPRDRRPCRGELIQIDGTPFNWLGTWHWTLLEFVDDATSALLAAELVPAESTQAYLKLLETYVLEHGLPRAIYSDRHSVFFAPTRADGSQSLTAFGQALDALQIEHIASSSPQARGRVERAHGLAQNRLAKELNNLIDCSALDENSARTAANLYLKQHWLPARNAQFAVAPACNRDAHRPCRLSPGQRKRVLAVIHHRRVDKNRIFSLHGQRYAVSRLNGAGHWNLKRNGVLIHQRHDGEMIVTAGRWRLGVKMVGSPSPAPSEPVNSKQLNRELDQRFARHRNKKQSPPADHPFKQASFLIMQDRRS